MKAVVQRVSHAHVEVDGRTVGEIGPGLLVLLGVQRDDGLQDVTFMAGKIANLRVFEDPTVPDQKMNRSVLETGGAVLVVSQFTLCGDTRKGRRPSFAAAAPPDVARALYEDVVGRLRGAGLKVATGQFQTMMRVHLVNDGPVTLLLDSRQSRG